MLSAAQEIRDRHTGEHVALVSHGAAIAILLSQLFNGIPFPFSGYHMSNTGVTLINWDFEPELISFDETLHLA
jgi:broad specificity phosphatase PhoE